MKWYWKLLIVLCLALGILTLVPWSASSPDFLGYYSLCSFSPVSTVGMFVIAIALYSRARSFRKLFFGTLAVLLIMFAFVGYWFFTARLPLNNIQGEIRYFQIWSSSYNEVRGNNITSITFNLTLRNPSASDAPIFRMENPEVLINNWVVPEYDVYCLNNWGMVDQGYGCVKWFGSAYGLALKGRQNIDLAISVWVEINKAPNDVWAALQNMSFTLTFRGMLTVRPYFYPDGIRSSMENGFGRIIWVARPLSVQSTYNSPPSSK